MVDDKPAIAVATICHAEPGRHDASLAAREHRECIRARTDGGVAVDADELLTQLYGRLRICHARPLEILLDAARGGDDGLRHGSPKDGVGVVERRELACVIAVVVRGDPGQGGGIDPRSLRVSWWCRLAGREKCDQ